MDLQRCYHEKDIDLGTWHAKAQHKAQSAAVLEAYCANPHESLLLALPASLHGWIHVVQHITMKSELLESIHLALFLDECGQIKQALVTLYGTHTSKTLVDPWSAFLGHCTQHEGIIAKAVLQAVTNYQTAHGVYLQARKRLIKVCCLNNSEDSEAKRTACCKQHLKFLELHCTVVRVKKLNEPYLPTKKWVVETPDIGKRWQDWCEKRKLRDKREGYFPVHLLDSTKLQHTVKEDASELIVNANNKELLAVVIRSWCTEQPVINAIGAHIANLPNIQQTAHVSFSYVHNLL